MRRPAGRPAVLAPAEGAARRGATRRDGSELRIAGADWDAPGGFRCRKPEFEEYLHVNAQHDRQQGMGKMHLAVSGNGAVGYMVLSRAARTWKSRRILAWTLVGHAVSCNCLLGNR